MTVLINPGAHIGEPQGEQAWTNTYAGALAQAREWHEHMHSDGFGQDVTLIEPEDREPVDGRWRFGFRHNVTGVVVHLDTHGIDDLDAYTAARIFTPRVYWAESSCSNPKLEDWDAPGFVQSFRPTEEPT